MARIFSSKDSLPWVLENFFSSKILYVRPCLDTFSISQLCTLDLPTCDEESLNPNAAWYAYLKHTAKGSTGN